MLGIKPAKPRKMFPFGATASPVQWEEWGASSQLGPWAFQEAVVCGAGMSGRFNWLRIYYLGWPEGKWEFLSQQPLFFFIFLTKCLAGREEQGSKWNQDFSTTGTYKCNLPGHKSKFNSTWEYNSRPHEFTFLGYTWIERAPWFIQPGGAAWCFFSQLMLYLPIPHSPVSISEQLIRIYWDLYSTSKQIHFPLQFFPSYQGKCDYLSAPGYRDIRKIRNCHSKASFHWYFFFNATFLLNQE